MNNPFPPAINKIAIIAPAGPTSRERVISGVDFLHSLGIETEIMPHVFSGSTAPYLAAEVHERLQDLHSAWSDSTVDAILCTRGGYGSAQLSPHIDWELLRSRPLPLIGYSDITALHLAMLTQNAGIPVAAPMCARLHDLRHDSYTLGYCLKALENNRGQEALQMPNGSPPLKTIKPGAVTAPVIAVNLAVMVTLCGTAYMPDLSGKILIIEDIAEPLYKIDRYLTQLSQANILSKLAGLIVGDFKDCGCDREQETLFSRIAGEINGPVLTGFPFGHSFPLISIKQNTMMQINTDGTVLL